MPTRLDKQYRAIRSMRRFNRIDCSYIFQEFIDRNSRVLREISSFQHQLFHTGDEHELLWQDQPLQHLFEERPTFQGVCMHLDGDRWWQKVVEVDQLWGLWNRGSHIEWTNWVYFSVGLSCLWWTHWRIDLLHDVGEELHLIFCVWFPDFLPYFWLGNCWCRCSWKSNNYSDSWFKWSENQKLWSWSFCQYLGRRIPQGCIHEEQIKESTRCLQLEMLYWQICKLGRENLGRGKETMACDRLRAGKKLSVYWIEKP